jgi:histidinol-phosphate aminotransferase
VIRENDTLAGLTVYRAGPPLREVEQRYGLDRLVVLASNESPEGPFPEVLEAMVSAAAGVNRYPDGGAVPLRAAIARASGLQPEQVVLGNGSCELLFFLTQAYLDRGDRIVFAEPTFTMYRPVASARGADIAAVPLRDHAHDLEALHREVDDRTRMVVVCNPNNPTGTYLAPEPLRDFVASLPPDVLVVLDEAYIEYVTAERAATEGWLAEFENLVILRTFSKIYGLAGLRVGYGLASRPVAEALDKVRQPFNVNSVAQAAALEAFSHPDKVQARREHVARERDRLYQAFDRLGVPYVGGSQANFVLVRIEGLSVPGPEVPQALLERGVVTRSGYSFGCPGWIRVTIGSVEEDDLFLHHLSQLVGGGAKP